MFDRYIFRGPVIPNLSFGGPGCLGRVIFPGNFWSFTHLILFDIMRPHLNFFKCGNLLTVHAWVCTCVYVLCRYKMRKLLYLHKLPLCE